MSTKVDGSSDSGSSEAEHTLGLVVREEVGGIVGGFWSWGTGLSVSGVTSTTVAGIGSRTSHVTVTTRSWGTSVFIVLADVDWGASSVSAFTFITLVTDATGSTESGVETLSVFITRSFRVVSKDTAFVNVTSKASTLETEGKTVLKKLSVRSFLARSAFW